MGNDWKTWSREWKPIFTKSRKMALRYRVVRRRRSHWQGRCIRMPRLLSWMSRPQRWIRSANMKRINGFMKWCRIKRRYLSRTACPAAVFAAAFLFLMRDTLFRTEPMRLCFRKREIFMSRCGKHKRSIINKNCICHKKIYPLVNLLPF